MVVIILVFVNKAVKHCFFSHLFFHVFIPRKMVKKKLLDLHITNFKSAVNITKLLWKLIYFNLRCFFFIFKIKKCKKLHNKLKLFKKVIKLKLKTKFIRKIPLCNRQRIFFLGICVLKIFFYKTRHKLF